MYNFFLLGFMDKQIEKIYGTLFLYIIAAAKPLYIYRDGRTHKYQMKLMKLGKDGKTDCFD